MQCKSAFNFGGSSCRLASDETISPGQRLILVLPRKTSAPKSQLLRDHFLNIIRNFMARPSRGASLMRRQLVQKRDLVNWQRIHVEEERVQPLMPPRRRPMKQARSHNNGDRHNPICQLSKQRRKAKQIGLPARGALGAHH